jgi:hypothetical protein
VLSAHATIIGFTMAVPFDELLMEIDGAMADNVVVVQVLKSAVQ